MFVTIAGSVAAEAIVKKSRFLALIERAESEDAARRVVASARSAHPGAGHHCSAFLIGDIPGARIERSSDDGEPTGTAGHPMLEVLAGRDLTNVVAVVSRYFGGTKLGTGGLARAYSGAVAQALTDARLVRRERRELVRVELSHADVGRIESELRTRGVEVVSIEYLARAVITFSTVDPDLLEGLLASSTAGEARPERLGSQYVDVAL
ncbi:IMPACT family protein [Rhodococcoides yunnanense]|uniref:IMPACT family protein n=1 Tax=Rhodococcoides yunnanense TaxID=278209 RepID=UPI0022B0F166|nr:YigZ family protein [Rhodococcus yunnanensis]MCZ4275001.1 IMPACT family protein [Rhodococcus yunnanensis]